MRIRELVWHRWLRRPFRLKVANDEGEGQPVVLLHGLASSAALWQPLIAELDTNKFRVVALDLLGFGASPAPTWNTYSVEEHARMVVNTLRKLRLGRPAIVVGHSMGCLIATHIAVHYPSYVSRLVLFEPPLFADVPEYKAHTRKRERYFSLFQYISTHPYLLFSHNWELRRLIAKISGLGMRAETWIPFQRSLQNAIMQQATFDELHRIAVPTDIIHGRLDFVVIRTDVKRMFAANSYIMIHTVNRMHAVSKATGKCLAKIINKYLA